MNADARVGWCPGALRPMESGDGLLVRVKPRSGVLTLDQAAGLTRLADTCGNGHLDLTGRANLQIRGVSEPTLAALHGGLDRLGLLDPDPDVEAVRNIVASPLAGLDPRAALDIRPIVAALEDRLATDPAFRLLPPKWSIVVDDGGPLPLDDVPADVRLVFSNDGDVFLCLGGAWAITPAETLLDALSRLARFIGARRPKRMRDFVGAVGVRALFDAAGLSQSDARPPRRYPVTPGALLGACHDLFIGTAPPFGSLTAETLVALIGASRKAGAQDIRLTPWRVLLVTLLEPSRLPPARVTSNVCSPLPCGEGLGVRVAPTDENAAAGAWQGRATLTPYPSPQGRGEKAGADARLVRDLTRLGFVTSCDDPRLRIVACTGAPGCHRATVPARADAAKLACDLSRSTGIGIHVSGCGKGCARSTAMPWTLVGRDGRYDLVRDGRAGDLPVARGLSFAEAAAWVRGTMSASAP